MMITDNCLLFWATLYTLNKNQHNVPTSPEVCACTTYY